MLRSFGLAARLGHRVLFRLLMGATCVAAVSGQPEVALAQGSKDDARKLFAEGTSLAGKGNHKDALEKLLLAEAAFHAPTHLLYIARSQDKIGQLLEAKATYKKLTSEQLAPNASRPFLEAKELGAEELADLERRIPRLVVVVTPENAAGLQVRVDDRVLSAAEMAEPFAVNPGPHEVSVSATGYANSNGKLTAELGRTSELRLALQPKGSDGSKGFSTSVRDTDGEGSEGLHIASIAMMAVGGAGLATGGVFGVLSLVTQADADELFTTCGGACQTEVQDKDNQASLFGNVGIIGLAAGGAVFGTGLVLFLVNDGGGGGADSAESQAGTTLDVAPGYIGLTTRF